MDLNSDSKSTSTRLHRNAFAILGASLGSSRAEINQLAHDKAFVLDEAVLLDSRRTLTNPVARLEAEVGWLPGLTQSAIEEVLGNVGLGAQLATLSDLPALSRANALSALLEMWLSQGVSKKWMEVQLPTLLRLVNSIDLSRLEEILNETRIHAGVQEVSRVELIEALEGQRTYYRETCKRILGSMLTTDQGSLLTDLLGNASARGELLHALVDEYALSIASELETLLNTIRSHKGEVLKFPLSRTREFAGVIKSIESYGQRVRPILLSREQRGLEHDVTLALFREVRGFAVELANDHDQYSLARQMTSALHTSLGIVDSFADLLTKDIATLNEIITEEYQREMAVMRLALSNQRTFPTPNQKTHQRSTSPIPNTATHPSLWNRVPASIRLIAVLMVIAWVGNLFTSGVDEDNALSSNSSPQTRSGGSQSANECSNISVWWDEADGRWTRFMDLANTDEPATPWLQSQMRTLIDKQRASNPPSAAAGFNEATVNYWQFVLDTVSGTAPSGNAWNLKNDRLFAEVELTQESAASKCGINLIESSAPTTRRNRVV